MFTDFRNPLSREAFKRPQEESLYYSSTSKKRSRSSSPPSYDRTKTVASTSTSNISVITASPSKPILSPAELNQLQAKVLRAKLMDMPNADDLEKQYEEAKKRSESGPEVCGFITFLMCKLNYEL